MSDAIFDKLRGMLKQSRLDKCWPVQNPEPDGWYISKADETELRRLVCTCPDIIEGGIDTVLAILRDPAALRTKLSHLFGFRVLGWDADETKLAYVEPTREELKNHRHTKDDGSWWEHDAQGIPLCRVCDQCRAVKLSQYRPEILRGYTQADVDEPIEPEE